VCYGKQCIPLSCFALVQVQHDEKQGFHSKSILLSLNNIVREVLPVAANDPYLQSETVSARKLDTMKGD